MLTWRQHQLNRKAQRTERTAKPIIDPADSLWYMESRML
jgi:hypothetical protein